MTVQVTRMEVEVKPLRLKAPFRITGYTFYDVPVVRVTVHGEGGTCGRGEAAGVYYLDDTPEKIARTLETLRPTVESGITRKQLARQLPIGGARNALDCALWELESQLAGVPVWKLAGLDQALPRITTFTLSADTPDVVGHGARAYSHARAIKLKLDGDMATDIARVHAVREARGDVWLSVDANQGYSLRKLEQALPAFVDAKVMLVEQPLPRGSEAELDGFDSPIPIAADESALGVDDVPALVGRFDVVNIKLDKCGGLTEALQMVIAARSAGLQVMVGNMVGTSLAMAPAFVIAQLCDYVDLDGPTFLERDHTPAASYDGGSIYCGPDVWGGGHA